MVPGGRTFNCHGNHERRHCRGRNHGAAVDCGGTDVRRLAGVSSLAMGILLDGRNGTALDVWWCWEYVAPEKHPRLGVAEREEIRSVLESDEIPKPGIPLVQLLRFRETWGLVIAKFLSDAAWYFYLFWLPRYLYDARGFDIKAVGSVAWIPHAAAGIGCLCGGGLSTWLLARQYPLNRARKLALGASAA